MKRVEEDQDLRGFFDAMIEKDLDIPTPDFPEVKKPKTISWWIPAGIAASLAAGFFLFLEKEPVTPPAPIGEVIIITLEEGPDQELQFNIEETTEMEIWESPTASLLTEF
ncbi:hypothetical protein J0A67_13745 [Algoriphagus aestuariicola]|uniref:Anti-sigma factor n=1 Tax=Algoriphagus aestuariicola TaxID=1852016 RepID=A0ABS3BST1_9BACT|nr:hypothetical protein [Algoriphagus aestuariicola]MBN7801931.1 hypothetical protein [Algoriphagus aestuariicola]